MNKKFDSGTPLSSKSGLNNSKSLYHDFVRPRSQFGARFGSSPFIGTPQPENFDFIPLSYSSPVHYTGGTSGNWNGRNQKSFDGSPAISSFNSRFGQYNTNRKYFHSIRASSNSNSSFSPYSNMDISRKYCPNRKRKDDNLSGNARYCDNISLYYHPSMLEDPWAELEQKMRNCTASQNSSLGSKNGFEENVSNLKSVDSFICVCDSDEGADSQETDSTVSVSDGSS